MLLITISPETMVFHLSCAPPRSHLLSVPSFAVFACFWLVVVYEITDRQPSKARVYFIVVICHFAFVRFERRATAPSPGRPSPRPGGHWFIVVYLKASDRVERSNLSARSQFDDALKPPPPAIIPKKCTSQNAAASPFPGRFSPHRA